MKELNEQPEEQEEKIRELSIDLNTAEGQVSFETTHIEGDLNSIIIDCDSKVEVIIESSLGYVLLKRQIQGVEYIPVRIRIIPQEDDLRDLLPFDKFGLNEKLIITAIGPKNIDLSLIIRID